MDTRLLSRLGTLRQLEIFLKVAEHKSIARAAQELHLSHSAVSIQVKKLADTLGLPLHEVLGKKLFLTEAGEEVVKSGHELVSVVSRLDERLNDLKGLHTGHLRVSVVTTAKYFLPRIIGAFCEEYPGVEVEFKVGNRGQILERLAANADDLYIFNDPPANLDVATYRFLPNPLAVIASAGMTMRLPKAGPSSKPPNSLAGGAPRGSRTSRSARTAPSLPSGKSATSTWTSALSCSRNWKNRKG